MKRTTITIGIPAYNEEANIGDLLVSLLNQNQIDFAIGEILVCSDKSTDNTEKICRSYKGEIKLLINRRRSGQAYSQNRIIKHSTGNILVMLNADIQIIDRDFLAKIIKPIFQKGIDLVSVPVTAVKANSFIEQILEASMEFKKTIFENYDGGNNIYTCQGRARAFSKRLYKKIEFPESIGEDAYTYLFCITNDFKYAYVSSTEVYYRLPANFSDHQKQSTRFLKSQSILSSLFGKKFVKAQYKLPLSLTLATLLSGAIRQPVRVLFYILVHVYMRFIYIFLKVDSVWELSKSTKRRILTMYFLGYEI